jgi:hypothetical protein
VKRTIVIVTSLVMMLVLAGLSAPAHARSLRQQRIAACKDKNSGDPCTYTRKGQDVNGTCESGRRKKLICTASTGTSEPGGAMNAPAGESGAAGGAGGTMGGGTMGGGTGAGGSPSTGTAGGAAGGAGGTGGTAP